MPLKGAVGGQYLIVMEITLFTPPPLPSQTLFVGVYCFHVVCPGIRPCVRPWVCNALFPYYLEESLLDFH